MAKNTKNNPLNPMAPPYLKILPTQFYIPQFTPHHRILHPLVPYNDHPQPRKSFPPSSSKNLSLTPVASGPRTPISRLFGSGRRASKPTGHVIGKRWKNTRGDYHQILPLESETTSVMIKNIPNKYTRELLIHVLDNHCKLENQKLKSIDEAEFISAYDYLYLPIDFKYGTNAGFAFVNFTNSIAALRFRDAFHGKRWVLSDSRKVAQIFRAKIQGKEALINNSKKMDLRYGSDEMLPVVFEPARDGSGRVKSQMLKLGKFVY
ncbi:hypothetical protein E3N88_06601 [Mikania micrantha]|uniref:RRM domain-containing protein n=1 Tax=Mikania micrantha TaxID=192012 RepID=A0A5N6PR60_9ASTR|nr:hypothetical protein E3N88_06601 [Mikania micrantha]